MKRSLPRYAFLAAALWISVATLAGAVSPDIVVSQVYGGGGNTGATYTHDFIELFNRGTTSISLTGWTVQYGSATGNIGPNAGQTTDLSGTLLAGQYLLIQEAQGAGGTTALPSPDVTDATPIAMAAGAGKVALVPSTTPLNCGAAATPCSAAQLAGIKDLVGYGSTANVFEGSGPTPTLTNTTAALRALHGCQDTDNNGADFTAGAPTPRNTATIDPCQGDAAPSITSKSPDNGATNVAVSSNVTVTFSEPVNVTDPWYSISCGTSGSHTAAVTGGPTVFTIDPDANFANGESCTVTVFGGQVSDQDTNDPPDTVSGNPSWSFATIELTGCDQPATHEIAAVQGPGDASPVAGQTVRVEGIVTGDFQGSSGLNGFFIQDPTPDADPATSEGLFVFSNLAVAVGDRVLVSGKAIEFNGLTEISPTTAVDVCSTGNAITALPYDLPRAAGVSFEPVENMLLTFPETLTATEHFQLGRFGEVTVSVDGRLFEPTTLVAPGAAANAMQAANDQRRLLIDDGSNIQNPTTVPFLTPDILRIGDTTSGITGVLSFGFSFYRLQPTAPITFARTNPRPPSPVSVGGDIRVASFNTLNYFTTLRSENPDARGADTAEEFARQQAKEVAAITGLNADVLGLMEVENNGATAIGSLVDALNDATAPGTYAYITEPVLNTPNEFGGTFGTDAIKVALIYRPAAVTPVGAALSSADPVFDRPPLIQTFQLAGGSEPFTVAVNHFKSKNCGGATLADLDQGDGQSCFNARRTDQATTLAALLDSLDVPNPLIIGDLNSHTEEDPIHTLEAAGYTGLTEAFVSEEQRYSFVFNGQSGELDHALAGADLLDNVTGATIWHINADEPLILDYNTEFNPPGLYSPDAYRSSDHDPVVVGLDLEEVPTLTALSPARIWVGLVNSDDVGIKFDLRAEIYRNGIELVGSGELASAIGGSSGFNNAKLDTIPLTLTAPVGVDTGDTLSIKLLVRNACAGSGKNSGRARLWFNDAAANSRFDTTIDGAASDWYLRDALALAPTPGPGPKKTIDVQAGAKCSAYKPFGTWTATLN